MTRHSGADAATSIVDRVLQSTSAEISEILFLAADPGGPLGDFRNLLCAAMIATGGQGPAWDKCLVASGAVHELRERINDAAVAFAELARSEAPAAAAG